MSILSILVTVALISIINSTELNRNNLKIQDISRTGSMEVVNSVMEEDLAKAVTSWNKGLQTNL